MMKIEGTQLPSFHLELSIKEKKENKASTLKIIFRKLENNFKMESRKLDKIKI